MVVVVGSNNSVKSGEGQRWFDLHYVFWCKIRTSISTPFPPLHYLILFVCNGPSIGLPDSFYMQWTLH